MTNPQNQPPEGYSKRELALQFISTYLHDKVDPLDTPLLPEMVELIFGEEYPNVSIENLPRKEVVELLDGLIEINLQLISCLSAVTPTDMKPDETFKAFSLMESDLLSKHLKGIIGGEEKKRFSDAIWKAFIEFEHIIYWKEEQ